MKVGQRVRVKAMMAMPNVRNLYIGQEGIIEATTVLTGLWHGRVGYWVVFRAREPQMFTENCLEEVVPEGSAPGCWADCVWKPKR